MKNKTRAFYIPAYAYIVWHKANLFHIFFGFFYLRPQRQTYAGQKRETESMRKSRRIGRNYELFCFLNFIFSYIFRLRRRAAARPTQFRY